MSFEEQHERKDGLLLKLGDFCFVKCIHNNKFYLARVMNVNDQGDSLHIFYIGWPEKWSVWLSRRSDRIYLFQSRVCSSKSSLLIQHQAVRDIFKTFCRYNQIGVYETDLSHILKNQLFYDLTLKPLQFSLDQPLDKLSSLIDIKQQNIQSYDQIQTIGVHKFVLNQRCSELLQKIEQLNYSQANIIDLKMDLNINIDLLTLKILLNYIYSDDLISIKLLTYTQLMCLVLYANELHLKRLYQKVLITFKNTFVIR